MPVLRSIAALPGWARQSTTFLRLELASCHSHLTLCLCNMVANVSSTGKSLVLAFFLKHETPVFLALEDATSEKQFFLVRGPNSERFRKEDSINLQACKRS